MLVRSARVSPSILLFLLFCALFGWQLSSGVGQGEEGPFPGPPVPLPESRFEPPKPKPEGPAVTPKAPSTAPKSKPRIALVTFVTNQRSYLHLSLKNKAHYARLHNYTFVSEYEVVDDISPVWYKYTLLQRLIEEGGYDWLWWLDFDTLITNMDTDIVDIVDEALKSVEKKGQKAGEIDYLLTHDCNDLNLGSFLVRSHPRSIDFLSAIHAIRDSILKKDPEAQPSEQDCMKLLIEGDKDSAARTVVVPQQKLNAFPEEIPCYEGDDEDRDAGKWSSGDFILHFAGAWAYLDKVEDPTGVLMKKYGSEVIYES